MSSSSPTSLRARLFRSLLGTSALVLALTGLGLAHFVERWLVGEFDRGLRGDARTLVSLSEQDDGEVEVDFVEELLPDYSLDEDPAYFQVWVDESTVFLRSPSLGGADLARAVDRSRRFRIRDVALPDGRPGRQLQVEFVPQIDDDDEEDEDECLAAGFLPGPVAAAADGGPGDVAGHGNPDAGGRGAAEDREADGNEDDDDGEDEGDEHDDEEDDEDEEDDDDDEEEDEWLVEGLDPTVLDAGYHVAGLVVARGREELDERLLALRLGLLGGGLLLLGLIAGLVHWTLRLGLRPVDEVSRRVASLDAEHLGARIEVEPPAELTPLVDKLNQLLARLHGAFERERRFASDVAHELRTPIAELRSLSDVGGRWPGDRESVQEFFDDVRDIAGHMEQVVEQLLELARADARLERPAEESVDVRGLVEGICAALHDVTAERTMSIDCTIDPSLRLRTDGGRLERILQNLVANAVGHGRRGATVEIAQRRNPGGVALVVANPADDLEAADLERMFDRFWRKDPSRGAGEGSGLGMSLVRAFADLLGMGVTAELDGDRLAITLSIPERLVERETGRAGRAAAG